jgi:hypothetical protein
VKDRRNKNNPCPFARKIALKGESAIPVGGELENGTMIAITKQLQAYIPEGGGMTSFQRRIEDVNTRYWGGNSSNIIALFTTKKKAMDCFAQEGLKPCDSRWIEETKKVIEKIGENHPAFEVCKWSSLSLLAS